MFEKFPVIEYPLSFDGKKDTRIVLTDLTTRLQLNPSQDQLNIYTLAEGETPEQVSYRLYDTPYYHWTILSVNNIHDVYDEWYLTHDQVLEYVKMKYNIVAKVESGAFNTTTNKISLPTGHGFKPRDKVRLTSTKTLPSPLSELTDYYCAFVGETYISLTTEPTYTDIAVEVDSGLFDTGENGHGLETNDKVIIQTQGDYPNGVSLDVYGNPIKYYVIYVSPNQFRLKSSIDGDALNIDWTEGVNESILSIEYVPVEFTTTGSGTITITKDNTNEVMFSSDQQGNPMYSNLVNSDNWTNDIVTNEEMKQNLIGLVYGFDIGNNYRVDSQVSLIPYRNGTNKKITKNSDGTIDIEDLGFSDMITESTQTKEVTYLEYEENKNAGRKNIVVIKPEYIKQFVKEYERILSVN